MRRGRIRLGASVGLIASVVGLTAAAGLVGAAAATHAPPAPACTGKRWVTGWAASPTDALVPVDATGAPVPTNLVHQTLRMVVAPHLGGATVRVRLSNRFGTTPITFGHVTIGRQQHGAAIAHAQALRFGGQAAVTLPAGADATSDPTTLTFAAFDHLAVSLYLPNYTSTVTKHWNANATSYLTPTLSGDHASQTSGAAFTSTVGSWLYLTGLDVLAPAPTRSVVAFGDSITDGFVSASTLSVPASKAVVDTDTRYPDDLQRRLIAARIPISMVNAGIGSNMLLTDGQPLMLGPSGLHRFQTDALNQAGVGGVLILEGINDLGLHRSPAADIIAGLTQLINQAHAAGVKAWLATILPAANALVDGTATAPNSDRDRQLTNTWIRGQKLADGVVDFDQALRDPANPSILRAGYASVDNLHPSPAGYLAMAQAVNLAMLATATCRT